MMPARPIAAFVLGLSVVALAACTVTPDYERPDLDIPESYREPVGPDASYANTGWWDLFEDERLKILIRTALVENEDLRIAIARIAEARAVLGIVRANQLPRLDVNATGGRQQQSEDLVGPLLGGGAQGFNQLTADVFFEIDLWGRLRRATEAAQAELLATEAAQRSVTITLVAAVASTYLLLRDFDERLAIAVRTVASREDSLRIIAARFDKGTVAELDVNQAEIELEDAKAITAAARRLVRQTENALSVLVGRNPGAILRGRSLAEQVFPPDIPAGLSSDLVWRRPDVIAAEQSLIAQTARIGVAQAERFPTLSLTGAFGGASEDLSDVTDGDSEVWNLFGNVFAPIFNAGQLKSNVEAERARTEQAVYAYEQSLQRAFQEVEDALIAVETYKDEYDARHRQVTAARNAARLSRARYDGGVVSYLEVLDSERSLFQAELLESQTLQQKLNAIVQLYKALGGGWYIS